MSHFLDPGDYYRDFAPFVRNKVYAVRELEPNPDRRLATYTGDILKYYTTIRNRLNMPITHVFGVTSTNGAPPPDWTGEPAPFPSNRIFLRDFEMKYPRNHKYEIIPMKKHYAEKAAEVGIATGTRVQGPATQEGKAPRTQAPVTLPRDVTRHIAEFAGQGRRRKTRRVKSL